jgi:prepilin-type N-terminal cleavage/methylation domain-containing protein
MKLMSRKLSRGATLIEVLVTFVILAIGILGLATTPR